ncbi:MAG: FAD-binding monooxygenase, partial [Comamonadaceae bacterium]
TSPIRKRLGLRLKSLDFDEPWIVVDVHVNEDQLSRLPATNIQYCDPARPCTYVVGPGTHRRWEFLLLPDEAGQREMPHDAIWKLLAPWLQPDQARLWRAATYRFHAVVLEQWRSGAVLMAGDAAHQMPPFLAQGMCQGLRDALNLSWKLDRVLHGQADDALLDTYGHERQPQVEEITATVKRLGQIICEREPQRARERDTRLRNDQGGQVRMQLRQSLLPGIHHGVIDRDQAPAGSPFPQPSCTLGTGQAYRLLDDLLPAGFLLMLRQPPTPAQLSQWSTALQALGAQVATLNTAPPPPGVTQLQEEDGVLDGWFTRHTASAALVRPDHVVFGIAPDLAHVDALLQRACQKVALAASTDTNANINASAVSEAP